MDDITTTGAAVRVSYWTSVPEGKRTDDFQSIEDFRRELAQHYISVIQARPSDAAGGGLYELLIEFISNLSLSDVVSFLLSGIAYDLVKSGSQAFILRPFLKAIERLKAKNPHLKIDEFRIIFQDTTLIIGEIEDKRKGRRYALFPELEQILLTVAKHHSKLVLPDGERPFAIHIPVFQDSENKKHRFRCLYDVDETIVDLSSSDYFRFWGIEYEFIYPRTKVYDVTNKILIHEEFDWERGW